MPVYRDILNSFQVDDLPNLDVVVMGALDLFSEFKPSPLSIDFKKPLVVGSGNAEATGRLLFAGQDVMIASESSFETALVSNPAIDGIVIISASGSKHAPIIAQAGKEAGKRITLITTVEDNPTQQQFADDPSYSQIVLPKNREPYTYNTSTYMGMILAKTGEDPAAIKQFIESVVDQIAMPDFSEYQKYFLIIPPQFSGICRMLQVKFIELFGREIARDVETSEYMRHATTVVPSEQELFISFGEENTVWGKPENRLYIPLPQEAGSVTMMAIGYYVVGKIQSHYEHLFKENIVDYAEYVSELFGSKITPIVE